MNTTFTTYAEKKAKQFFNLLQGYTRGIRITAILILLLMGVGNASAAVTVYFENTVNWENVYVYFYSSSYWDNSNGSGSKNIKSGPHQMTYDAKLGLHKYTYNGTHSGYIAFTKDSQSNYGNFWQTAAVYRGDFNSSKPVFIPSTTSSGSYNSTTYYNDGSWDTFVKGVTYTVTVPTGTTSCYIIGSWDWNNFNQMNQDPNDANKFTITFPDQTKYHAYKYACAPNWAFQELNGNCNGTINDRTYSANDVVQCWSLKTIYFKPNSDWKQANARFEVNWWIDGESHSGWVDLVQTECDDYYVAQVPLYKAKVKFCRTNPNNGYDKWNTIDNQTVPTDDNNLFTVTDWGSGSWSSSLQTITTNTSADGSISVSPSTTVELGSEITITFTPKSGNKIKSYTIAGETTNVAEEGSKSVNLTICGPTTILAEFEPKANPVIYLRPNDTWLSDDAVFAAYVWKSSNDSEHEWLELTTKEDDFTGAYSATIPSKYDRVIFARFQPETTSFGFNDKQWNRTIDLYMTLDNLEEYGYRFAITDDNKVDGKFNGAWEQNTAIWGIEGSFNGWTAENAVLKGYEGTTTVELDAQDYEFKLYNFPHQHHYGNTGTMLRGGSENWQMDYNGVNCGIKADMEGDYVFKLKFTTDNSTLKKRVTVVYPEKVFVVKGLLAAYEINQGETYTITPKVILPDGKQENNVGLVVNRTSGSDKITATASGLNIKITGTAAGDATFEATYTLDDKSYEFTFTVTVVADDKVTIQVKVPTNFGDEDQYQWKDPEQIKIHYWGNGISDGDITMTYLSTVNEHIILQARVPKGTDNKTNFLVYYNYYNNNDEKWRKTDDVNNVSSNGCYLLWKEGVAEKYHRGITREGAKCTEYFQVEIVMGSGKTFYSNALYNADQSEILSFFAPGESEIGYKKGSVKLLENGIAIANIPASSFAVSGVYTATLNADKDGLENIALYDGDYYIRTDGASGMWSDYLNPEKNNKMTYFIPREYEKYDHYWAESITPVDNKVNIKACVANQYNEDLANMLTKDRFTNDDGNVECSETANVRFGYNPSTNHFERAVLKGSKEVDFLNIISDQIYKEEQCNTKLSSANSNSQFTDQSNWVYEKDVYVRIENNTSFAEIVISSTAYNGEVNHLLGYEIDPDNGNETTTPKKRTIVGSGTDAGTYMIRTIYDFKTNRMIMAWVPGTQDITGEKTINADVLFIRHEQEAVPQLTLGTTGSVRSLEGVFFALELDRDERTGYLQEEHYWISLPFDCKVGSISGVPGYMTTWGIQRYRGDLRAEKGWFKETPTFWEWMGLDDTMNAGEGYVLSFDKRLASWKYIGEKAIVRLYFPAMSNGFDFTNSNNLSRTYKNQPCTITRDNRHIQDSNWKVIGTLSYNNATASNVDNTNPNKLTAHPSFVYEYQYGQGLDNSAQQKNPKYNPVNGVGYAYKSFHGYMVQFAGTITWNSLVASAPEQLAARRNTSSMPTNVTMRLELVDGNDVQHDQTFVALDEDGTTTFDQNKDLNKVLNTGYANIYTLSEGIPFAGNTLPMDETVVPVGVKIDAEGEYTFRMPDGTEGMVVELIDYETNTRTNLLLSDYTITLSAGSYENRFALHIQPQKDVVTGVGNVGDETKGIEKYLIDGKLIIRTAEGAVYDAQGHVVQ